MRTTGSASITRDQRPSVDLPQLTLTVCRLTVAVNSSHIWLEGEEYGETVPFLPLVRPGNGIRVPVLHFPRRLIRPRGPTHHNRGQRPQTHRPTPARQHKEAVEGGMAGSILEGMN